MHLLNTQERELEIAALREKSLKDTEKLQNRSDLVCSRLPHLWLLVMTLNILKNSILGMKPPVNQQYKK